MTCLLCDAEEIQLRRDEDRWLATCPRCGRYQFDEAFGELVKHARANGQNEVLRQLARLAALARRSPDTLFIRRNNVARLLDAARSPSSARRS